MAFLNINSSFPPNPYWYNKYNEWEAWYSGDPQNLLEYYTVIAAGSESAQEKFWARIEQSERAGICHMPIAGDIASTSGNLLFSEPGIYTYDKESEGGKRIKYFMDQNGFDSILLEAAELAAALSGCVLKLDIAPSLLDIPVLSVVTPTQFFPTFFRGRLWEILFFRVVKETQSGVIYRLFENRRVENNSLLIEYRLCKGTSDSVGIEVELNSIAETENLNLDDIRYNNVNSLGCIYCPNMKPNKLMPGSPLGMNDYGPCITLMDSLDFAWTSWMRDIELGMGQIFVDEELLAKQKSETSGTLNFLNKFSKFQKSFIKLNLTSWRMGGDTGAKPIDNMQFDIRVDEHAKTCYELTTQIVSQSGYSPQTFGLGDFGTAASGTALRIRENKSQLTRNKKGKYWVVAIKSLLAQMQRLDIASNLSSNYEIQEVSVELEDSIVVDSMETSEIIRNLEQARSISVYQKIKLLHPDWDEETIQNETEKILQEQGITSEIIPSDV